MMPNIAVLNESTAITDADVQSCCLPGRTSAARRRAASRDNQVSAGSARAMALRRVTTPKWTQTGKERCRRG
jgi:hypothetical protein